MFERFTDRARRVIVLAQEEARRLDHGYIGTEHLLLGIIAQGDGVGGKALEQLGLSQATARADVERIIGRGPSPVSEAHIPFTPRSKAALEAAFREALALNHNYIGTEHVLLGLLRMPEGVAGQIMVQRFGGLDVVRNTVLQILMTMSPAPTTGLPPPGAPLATDTYSPGLRSALELASGHAIGGPTNVPPVVGTHHVLAVFAEWEELAANAVLKAGGFDASKLPTPITEWDVAGTSDETDDQRSKRVTEVVLGNAGITVRLLDEELSGRLARAVESGDVDVQGIIENAVRDLLKQLPPTPPETSD